MKRINTNDFGKLLLTAFFALTTIVLSGSAAQAQHGYRLEKPLKFAAGKSSAVAKGRIANEQEAHEYTITARAEQTLAVRLNSPNKEMTFLVMNAEFEAVKGFSIKGWNGKGELPADGEYKINVSANRGKGNYTLYVEIKDKEK